MEFTRQFSHIAGLLGDKARSRMLWHLLDGRAYTATELALCADVSFQSASNHLTKLVAARLLTVEKQGRHRYFRYASAEVAQVVESMASLVELPAAGKAGALLASSGITYARTCYDHLAGRVGVEMTNALVSKGMLRTEGKRYEVSPGGEDWFRSVGVELREVRRQKRCFARACLDWSERKHHLAGALGAALLEMMFKEDWIRRSNHSRQVWVTPKGTAQLQNKLLLSV